LRLQHHRNLNGLEEQAAKFGTSEIPTRLRNGIDDEKKRIAELEEELKGLGG
jgi:hypothetical protein